MKRNFVFAQSRKNLFKKSLNTDFNVCSNSIFDVFLGRNVKKISFARRPVLTDGFLFSKDSLEKSKPGRKPERKGPKLDGFFHPGTFKKF
ncbi:hypothetical protein A0128_07795 [Leptospira tipperaryensis]|uniref:Uncharacterized protein n=1 Tax=Leptospira tipperaryensis TaxID=2564040 RepID=A0A1D7UVZ0_9LEPT|nr:hypothetical protein A0128_07795 [Leptospira tipperaryensis]